MYLVTSLTNTQDGVKNPKPNIHSKEEDDVGHFTEQEQVAYMLLNGDYKKGRQMGWQKMETR